MSDIEKGRSNQYLIFQISKDNFAISALRVKEILVSTYITKIPRMPDFLRGVTNLRGNVIPIIDLGMNLGMASAISYKDTYIIVTEVFLEGDSLLVGMLVDRVNDVVGLPDDMIGSVPPIGANLSKEFVIGIGKTDEASYTILDIDSILAWDEALLLENAALP